MLFPFKYTVEQFVPKKNDTALVIPVLNEGERIKNQLISLRNRNLNVDVIVVDGKSTDGSIQGIDFREMQLTALLTKECSGGLSRQLQIAFKFCNENQYKYVITMDGNNKDDASGIAGIQSLLNSGFDFVQGSRFIAGGVAVNTPKSRLFGVRFIHAPVTSLASRNRITDSTNGFRGHSMSMLCDPRMSIFRDVFETYELVAYIPIRAGKLNYRIKESPVSRSYPAHGATPTKIVGLWANFKLFKILLLAALGAFDPDR
jgi:dolichol-phosphate mannosyltransferase